MHYKIQILKVFKKIRCQKVVQLIKDFSTEEGSGEDTDFFQVSSVGS